MKIIKYVFSIVGLGLLVGAFILFTNTKHFLEDALTTDGTVIELVRSRSSSNSSDSITYKPVVEFVTQDGTTVEFMSSSGSNPPSYTRGNIVEVMYHNSFPEKAKINSFFSLWGGATIFTIMGSIFFLIGISIILAGYLKLRKTAYLRKSGVPIKAKFQKVEIDESVKMNGNRPYRIYAQWKNPASSKCMYLLVTVYGLTLLIT